MMNGNLQESMQQSKHNIFGAESFFMKIPAKINSHWACFPSKALVTNEMKGTENVHSKLHSMVDKTICNI
jgi:hypothetical protein